LKVSFERLIIPDECQFCLVNFPKLRNVSIGKGYSIKVTLNDEKYCLFDILFVTSEYFNG